MTKLTRCASCGGWTGWDDCGGFDDDDYPICESCMDRYCDYGEECSQECDGGNQCPKGKWRRNY